MKYFLTKNFLKLALNFLKTSRIVLPTNDVLDQQSNGKIKSSLTIGSPTSDVNHNDKMKEVTEKTQDNERIKPYKV